MTLKIIWIRLLLNLAIIVVCVYVLFGIFLFVKQKSMIYFPDNQDFWDCPGFGDYEKVDYSGTRIYFKQQSQSAIVYYHGNAGSACDRSANRFLFEKTNHSVIFVEYAGYSADSRKPSMDLILQDVRNVESFLKEKSFSHITIYGQSLGSGAASYHASLGAVDNLILVSPFSTLREVAQSIYKVYPSALLLSEDYDNIAWLQDYEGRVIILHGDKDVVLPQKFSVRLFDSIPSQQKQYVLIQEYGHNNIWGSDLFKEKIVEFIGEEEK